MNVSYSDLLSSGLGGRAGHRLSASALAERFRRGEMGWLPRIADCVKADPFVDDSVSWIPTGAPRGDTGKGCLDRLVR